MSVHVLCPNRGPRPFRARAADPLPNKKGLVTDAWVRVAHPRAAQPQVVGPSREELHQYPHRWLFPPGSRNPAGERQSDRALNLTRRGSNELVANL